MTRSSLKKEIVPLFKGNIRSRKESMFEVTSKEIKHRSNG